MIIKTWTTKDIYFTSPEREEVTKYVLKLLKKGWELHIGVIVLSGVIMGDTSDKSKWLDGQETEEIQLYNQPID